MKTRKDGALLRQLNTLFNVGAIRELTDGQLLERFSTGPGEAAELAFAALVERHGAMVLRICRAQLGNHHDAQDAFQATFLILVKKARSLWVRDSLGPWLHQVAFRTASCARSAATRRRRHERRSAETAASYAGQEDPACPELEQVLHEEINRLPECYRAAIVLCDLQGYTCEQAARRMGRPVGTVKCWRFRGRERLRERLFRLGLAPAAAAGSALSVDVARAAVSRPIAEETVRVAVRALANRMTPGEVSASVRTLVKGVLNTMFLTQLRTTAIAVFAMVFLAAGLGTAAWVVAKDWNRAVDEGPRPAFAQQPLRTSSPVNERSETWSLTLREAVRIGLNNTDAIRVISIGANGMPCTIAPSFGGGDPQRFKAEVMAHVRSIEQQYWNLSQAHVQQSSVEKLVELAQGVLDRELRAKGKATHADVAEVAQRLQQFNLEVVTKTSDAIASELMLRTILGLPPSDGRRIVPITVPTETRLEPDWDDSLAVMLEKQPDVVRARAIMKQAEDGSARLARQRALFQQVVHETTHSLARFFLEIEANYKQFRAASNRRAAAAQRREAERASYEERRGTVEHYLDAASQYASAVALEAQYKTVYNIAIVALDEAKGTLLEYEQISIAEGPKPAASTGAVRDGAVKPASREAPAPIASASAAVPPASASLRPPAPVPAAIQPASRLDPSAPQAKDTSAKAGLGGKTYSFQVTIGIGSKPIEIRGSFTITPIQSGYAPKVD